MRIIRKLVILFLFLPCFVFASEAKITVINGYDGGYETGDCVLIESSGKYLLVDTCTGFVSKNYFYQSYFLFRPL